MADVPTVSWDESSPPGSQSISLGDDRIREMKTQIREVIAVDHVMDSSGQDTDFGYHNHVTLAVQADDPVDIADTIMLYSKDVEDEDSNTRAELHAVDEDGNEMQLTSKGKLLGIFDDVKVAATRKLYLDGGGDTYISETSANVMAFYAADTLSFKVESGKITIPTASKFYLDGGTSTYITALAANNTSFYVSGNLVLSLGSSQVCVSPTHKFYLDGGGDTYLVEYSANNVYLYLGSAAKVNFAPTTLHAIGTDLLVDAQFKLYLDGGDDTYIVESSANVIDFYTSGTRRQFIDGNGVNIAYGIGQLYWGPVATEYWNINVHADGILFFDSYDGDSVFRNSFYFNKDGWAYALEGWTTFSPDIRKHALGQKDTISGDDYLEWALEDARKPVKNFKTIPKEQSEIDKYGKDICKIAMGTALWASEANKLIKDLAARVAVLEA